MQHSFGQLIDHLHLKTQDFDRASGFYLAIFEALGHLDRAVRGRDWIALDEFYLDGCGPGEAPSHLHLCFRAATREAVMRFHKAGLASGGRDNGAPGLRDYHPGYFAAYLTDPDGNNIEAKCDERG